MNFLSDITSYVWKIAWIYMDCAKVCYILVAVVWPYVESLKRFPYQLFLIIGSFQILADYLFPLSGCNRWKFGKKLFLLFSAISRLLVFFSICKINN